MSAPATASHEKTIEVVIAEHSSPAGLAENAVSHTLLEAVLQVVVVPSSLPAWTLSAYKVAALSPVKVCEALSAGTGSTQVRPPSFDTWYRSTLSGAVHDSSIEDAVAAHPRSVGTAIA